ncbi:MAG: DMT family transporter [Candidatus Zixiibacteriota bacterium]
MRAADIARLLLLAAIWGGSFIFMRVLAPVLGPVLTADLRVMIAGLTLILYFRIIKFDPQWRPHWKKYLLIGSINSALPFFLFSFAALHIPASYSVILNSTSPFFAALFSAMWLHERLTIPKLLGLVVGAVGVGLVVRVGTVETDSMVALAVGACLLAAICYGLTATYIRRFGKELKPMSIAGASQVMAGLVLIPLIPFSPMKGELTLTVGVTVVIFSLLCSAVAYLLYYRLIADLGATKALTVTFLMPAFGMLWGFLILHEQITPGMILGAILILTGCALVLAKRKLPAK